MKIISINIRGLGGGHKWKYLKGIIVSEGVDMICIQETKLHDLQPSSCYKLWGDNKIEWVNKLAMGNSGGILTMWHKDKFKRVKHIIGESYVGVIGEYCKSVNNNPIPVAIFNVYSSCNFNEKIQLWEELITIKSGEACRQWCVLGDFNAVRKVSERRGLNPSGNTALREVQGFNKFIESMELIDVPLIGGKYTWYKENGTAKSRIDRVLVSLEWMEHWSDSKQFILDRQVSDHCALLIKQVTIDWGPKPFKTLDIWESDPTFKNVVKQSWHSYIGKCNPMIELKEKLKKLKFDLKLWNKEVFGNIGLKKQNLLQELHILDMKDDESNLGEDDMVRRTNLLSELRLLLHKESALLNQKARLKWIEQGDTNSKYFHSRIRWRRITNEFKGVDLNGLWCEDPEKVKQEVRQAFQKRFSTPKTFNINLKNIEFKKISEEDNSLLTKEIGDKEIEETINQCGETKSPGPDGFNFLFLKHNWGTLKNEVNQAVKWFWKEGKIPKGCNASFIALVPKKQAPLGLDDYRPISLVGCVYKIISKILANRLKNVLPKVIHSSQSAFIKGRGLMDSILVANETVEECRLKKKRLVIVKVDYEKAYDSINWDFLYYMLNRMGFCDRWIGWIQECLGSSSVSVLVNGSPTKEFVPTRGLRQGDPMAPFLFLIVAEGLAGLVRQAIKKNLYSGIKVGTDGINVGLLQFADDTLFLCEANAQNAQILKAILRCFELVSGLRVNFSKTKVGGLGLDATMINEFSSTLNCKHMKIPFEYLGMQIGGNPRLKQF